MAQWQRIKSLEHIAAEIERCVLCRQDKTGVAVPGEGSAHADIVFVGEAPGKQEAQTGRPFIGRSGKLLRACIRESGLKEEDVFITSAVKYLPIHVTPRPDEIAHGRIHLEEQLHAIDPKLVVLLGRVAAIAVLGESPDLRTQHGVIFHQDKRAYMVMYHPAAALYAPALRSTVQKDFQVLQAYLKTGKPTGSTVG
jgi:DNA polymerase